MRAQRGEGIIDASMGVARESRTDFLVIGGGIAGLRAAIDLAKAGTVLILTKGHASDSATRYTQAGSAFAQEEEEDVSLHLTETLRSGDGLCREEAVRILVEESPRELRQLAQWGVKFEAGSRFSGGGSRKRGRVLAGAVGSLGTEIFCALTKTVQSLDAARIRRGALAVDLLMDEDHVCGMMYLDKESGGFRRTYAKAILLATGGMGRVYAETANSTSACGDGVALAFRAGALLSDMEFIQFHPTVLYVRKSPRVVLPAALREQGAHLRNIELERFMPRYHEAGELAPPDILTRAIQMEMQRSQSELVYLDLTGLDARRVKQRFPQVHAACLESNLDITSDLIPVRPAAQFSIGGVATDLDGASTLKGLYAAGEAAATGVHGANRLANNALLESLVFGARAAAAMIARHEAAPRATRPPEPLHRGWPEVPTGACSTDLEAVVDEIRRLMWSHAGIIRHGAKLKEALDRLNAFTLPPLARPTQSYYDALNLVEIARLITRCAEARRESRGTHYRADFPLRNGDGPALHSFVSRHSSVYFQ